MEYKNPLSLRMKKAEWRRNKYHNNAEFRELEKAYSREYQRKKRLELKEEKVNDQAYGLLVHEG